MAAKDINYFMLFIKGTEICKRAAEGLCVMLSGTSSFSKNVEEIHKLTFEGEKLFNQTYDHLSRSFITPIEREDIIGISRSINQVVNAVEQVAIMLDIFSVTLIKTESKELAGMILKSCGYLVEGAREFENFKKSKRFTPITIEINRIGKRGTILYQTTMKKLLDMEKNSMEIIKWKSIFDAMKNALEACENVADTMKEVIIKNS